MKNKPFYAIIILLLFICFEAHVRGESTIYQTIRNTSLLTRFIWTGIVVYAVGKLYLHIKHKYPEQQTFQANSQTAFVFDLHDVIMKRDYIQMVHQFFQTPDKVKALVLFLNPFFVYDVIRLWFTSHVSEEYIVKLAQKYPSLKPYIDQFITITNEQIPIKDTVHLIHLLKQYGYNLYLFSNIGEKTFKELRKKYPDLFKLFNGIQVVSQKNNWIQKPQPESFKQFLYRFTINPSNMIFIDDNKDNIEAARKFGIYAIHFRSPEQLKNELFTIGALESSVTPEYVL